MNIAEFLTNPAGKGDTAINMKAVISVMEGNYDKYIRSREASITCDIYKPIGRDVFFVHLKMPTETERGNDYDVVVKLEDKEGLFSRSRNVSSYDAKFFCNAPSFAFTYAKVYNDNDILVPELKNKFSKQQLTKNPEVRNRYGIVGYDKYLYYGVRYLKDSGLLEKEALKARVRNYNKPAFNGKIRTVDVIMKEYRVAEKKSRSKNKDVDAKKTFAQDAASTVKKIGHKISPVKPIAKKKETVKRIKKK